MIDNITLSSSEHMAQFYAAADWFVKNQDTETGGWPIPVRRRLANGFAELKPGWFVTENFYNQIYKNKIRC